MLHTVVRFNFEGVSFSSESDVTLLSHHRLLDEAISAAQLRVVTQIGENSSQQTTEVFRDGKEWKTYPDGYYAVKSENGLEYVIWKKYTKPGKWYGGSRSQVQCTTYQVISLPFVFDQAPPKESASPRSSIKQEKTVSPVKPVTGGYSSVIDELKLRLEKRAASLNAMTPPTSPVTPLSQTLLDSTETRDSTTTTEEEATPAAQLEWKIFVNPMWQPSFETPVQPANDDTEDESELYQRACSFKDRRRRLNPKEFTEEEEESDSDSEVYYIGRKTTEKRSRSPVKDKDSPIKKGFSDAEFWSFSSF